MKNSVDSTGKSNRVLVSSLKGSARAKQTSYSGQSSTTDDTLRNKSSLGDVQSRRNRLQQSHTNSNSFSLENILFEGLLSEGICDPNQTRVARRTLSFEDLSAIKKELNEGCRDAYDESDQIVYYNDARRSATPLSNDGSTSKLIESSDHLMVKSHTAPSLSTYAGTVGRMNCNALSKNDILALWRTSERKLLAQMQNHIDDKRALEEQVARLHKMLQKPP